MDHNEERPVQDPFWLDSYVSDDTLVIRVGGEIDIEKQPEFQHAILQGLARRPVVVEMSEVSFVGISVLRSLVVGHRTALSRRRALVLAAVPPSVMRLLIVAQLQEQLTLTRSLEAGLEAVHRLDALWDKTRTEAPE